jgi:dTDP-4-dehydrorhamnose reductase
VKLLITGAAGLVGRHLAKRMARDHEVVALNHAHLDITDAAAIESQESANDQCGRPAVSR